MAKAIGGGFCKKESRWEKPSGSKDKALKLYLPWQTLKYSPCFVLSFWGFFEWLFNWCLFKKDHFRNLKDLFPNCHTFSHLPKIWVFSWLEFSINKDPLQLWKLLWFKVLIKTFEASYCPLLEGRTLICLLVGWKMLVVMASSGKINFWVITCFFPGNSKKLYIGVYTFNYRNIKASVCLNLIY